jgi:hypothetical protein
MIMIEGIALGHHVSFVGIQVEPAKIEVIVSMSNPTIQIGVRCFLFHAGYYQCFFDNVFFLSKKGENPSIQSMKKVQIDTSIC